MQMMIKKSNNFFRKLSIVLLFFVIVIFSIYKLIFSDALLGRAFDSSITPVSFLMKNAYLMNFYSWWGVANSGTRNTFSAALIPVNSVLHIPLIFHAGSWFLARYQIVITIFLGMLFFYLLASRLIDKKQISGWYREALLIFSSIFFVLNNYFFSDIVFGSNVMYLTLAFLPLLLYAVISFFETGKKRYFALTLFSIVVISSTLQHLVVAYIFLFVICLIYKRLPFFFKVAFLHTILSLYWILPLVYSSHEIVNAEMSANYTSNLSSNSSTFFASFLNSDYFGMRDMYRMALGNSWLSLVWTVNACIVVLFSFAGFLKIDQLKKNRKKIFIACLSVFIFSIIFIKGSRDPFGEFVYYAYQHFSPLNLFRSIQRYISFYVMSISIAFLISGWIFMKKNRNIIYLIGAMVILNAMPWWITLDLGRENNVAYNKKAPAYFGEYNLSAGDFEMYSLNLLKNGFHILTVPPGFSIEFAQDSQNNEKLQGGDAGLAYGNKGFYSVDSSSGSMKSILTDLESQMYGNDNFFGDNKNIFSLLNIEYFVLRKDVAPVFSPNSKKFNFNSILISMDSADFFSSVKTIGEVTLIKNRDFLSHFYTSHQSIVTNRVVEDLPRILSSPDWQTRSAVFFMDQNGGKEEILAKIQNPNLQISNQSQSSNNQSVNSITLDNEKQILQQAQDDSTLPTLEFKKINPTKYRVRVHGARGVFPLVFSESFHDGWKSYLVNQGMDSRLRENDTMGGYKILDGNSEDQATKDELREYIDNGYVTTLGDVREKTIEHKKWENNKERLDYVEKYNIDFVSKNFQGTIQNDNLPNGNIFETWFQKPIENNTNHLMANGYANSWVVDTNSICGLDSLPAGRQATMRGNDTVKCIRNPDGTYDFELVVEFWPQRLFYIGLFISGITLLCCLGYLGYDWKRRKGAFHKVIESKDAKILGKN